MTAIVLHAEEEFDPGLPRPALARMLDDVRAAGFDTLSLGLLHVGRDESRHDESTVIAGELRYNDTLLFSDGHYLGPPGWPAALDASATQSGLRIALVFGGFAQNFAYSACLSNTIRFFPDKKGLASGLITGGMGGAAIIAAPIANTLIERYGVSQAFWRMGLAYALIGFFFSLFIRSAPKQAVPQTAVASEKAPAPAKTIIANKNWKEMLASPAFYLLILMFAMGAFSGLMIASNASLIGQSMFGLSASAAAAYVSLYSLSNTSGRVFWGAISDRIGQIRAVIIIYSAIIFAFILLVSVNQVWAFAIGIVTLGLCFGGVMGVFPGLVMDNFGPANQGVNYGIVFIGFSSAAFVAPKVTASLAAANNGDFTKAFYVAIAVVLFGLGLSLVYAKRKIAAKLAAETAQ